MQLLFLIWLRLIGQHELQPHQSHIQKSINNVEPLNYLKQAEMGGEQVLHKQVLGGGLRVIEAEFIERNQDSEDEQPPLAEPHITSREHQDDQEMHQVEGDARGLALIEGSPCGLGVYLPELVVLPPEILVEHVSPLLRVSGIEPC